MNKAQRQCENLTDGMLKHDLGIDSRQLDELINELHKERVLRYKYTFKCPWCNELNTIYEDENEENLCQICGHKVDVDKMLMGAHKRYIIEKEDFKEYENEIFDGVNSLVECNNIVPIYNGLKGESGKSNGGQKEMNKDKKNPKLFISHSSKDEEYVIAFVEFLEDIGMPENSFFCSSCDGYDISWGKDIYEYLADEFQNEETNLIVLFMLSDNYYSSAACLNEMGAAWILKKEYRSILLPGFQYEQIKGAINAGQRGIKLDDPKLGRQLNEIKNQFSEIFEFDSPNDSKWDRVRENFIDRINNIMSKRAQQSREEC